MRGAHCLKVWTKKQQVMSLSIAESELCAAVKTASEGLVICKLMRQQQCVWSTAGDGAPRNT